MAMLNITTHKSPRLKPSASRRFIATVAAAATALALLTVAAVPARAGQRGDDFAKAIAGLAAIAMYSTVMNRSNDHVIQAWAPLPRQPAYKAPKQDQRRAALPRQCALQLRGHHQSEVVYPKSCLRQAGVRGPLPQQCEVLLPGRRHGRVALEENCLLQAGFNEQGRRHRH